MYTHSSYCLVLAGEDAVKFEGLPDDVVVAKAVAVLRSIFGDPKVPEVRYSHSHSTVLLHCTIVLPSCCHSSILPFHSPRRVM